MRKNISQLFLWAHPLCFFLDIRGYEQEVVCVSFYFFFGSSFFKYAARPIWITGLSLGILFFLAACSLPFGSASTSTPLGGHIRIDGSTALQPLVTKAVPLFESQYPKVRVDVSGGGSLTGLKDVNSHKVDIGDSDIYADPANYPDPNLTDHLICVIPFTMIVSSDIPVTDLSISDIIDIFAIGKITNWNQIKGGPDLRIKPIVRPPTSGTRATFRRYVLGGRDEKSGLTTISSSQDLVKAVATTPGAIGYLAASVLDSHVHALSINGYAATLQNIEGGHYSFWSYEHMYTLNVSNNSPVAAFLDFMLTPQVQQQATGLHYIPIADLKFPQLSSAQPKTVLRAPYLVQERRRYTL
jgi:phosphate transport system substrate-binding protein